MVPAPIGMGLYMVLPLSLPLGTKIARCNKVKKFKWAKPRKAHGNASARHRYERHYYEEIFYPPLILLRTKVLSLGNELFPSAQRDILMPGTMMNVQNATVGSRVHRILYPKTMLWRSCR